MAAGAGRRSLWGGVLFVLACVFCYAGSTGGPFLFDDQGSIVTNPNLRSLTPVTTALDAPEGTGADARPLVALSLALNYAVGELEPAGYRLTNILMHALAALLLFGLVRRLLAARRLEDEPTVCATICAAVFAGLWAAHPIHTATIHHVIQRSGILVALFYLGTLYAAVRGFRSERPGRWLVVSVLACALGCGSKEVIVTAPLVVLLLDRGLFAGTFREALRSRRLYYLCLAATWIVLALVLSTGNRSETAGFDVEQCPPIDYLRTQTTALLLYGQRVLWPSGLVFDYGGYEIARSWGEVGVEAAAVALLLAITAYGLLRNRFWGWIAASVFLVLSPTSSFVPLSGAVVAEHRMYLAAAGVLGLACLIAARTLELAGLSAERRRVVLSVLGVVACACLAVSTSARNRVFDSEVAVWSDTSAKRPENARAHSYLGNALLREGRQGEAQAAYRKAIAANPAVYQARINLGGILLGRGEAVQAEALYAEAAELRPTAGDPRLQLGLLLLGRGDTAVGIASLRGALARDLDPRRRTRAQRELAWVLATTTDPALRDGAEALRLAQALNEGRPPRPLPLATLGAALAESGRFPEARAALDGALRAADPSATALHQRLTSQRDAYARGEAWRE